MLLIDADGDTRDILRMLLERNGYRVLESGAAEEGVEMALTFRPDAVISEFMIPPRHGRCVPEALKRSRAQPRVHIVFTADVLPEISEKVEAMGCVYLEKPLHPVQVLEEVERRLARPEA